MANWRQVTWAGSQADRAALLPQRQGCDPDWDKPILAKRQSKLRMTDDIEKEFTTVSRMGELLAGRSSQRNSAENKRTRIVRELLLTSLALLADEHNGF